MKREWATLWAYWRYEVRFALVALFTVIFVGLLIMSALRVHMRELEVRLRESEFLDNGTSQIYLTMRYMHRLQLYKGNMPIATADRDELLLHAILSADAGKRLTGIQIRNTLDRINVFLINGVRFLLGHSPLPDMERESLSADLALAYYYERRRDYRKALEIYDRLRPDERLRSLIWLHAGFCHAMLGETPLARDKYEAVIRYDRDREIGVLAKILLGYLHLFEREAAIQARKDLSEERIAALTWLGSCSTALEDARAWVERGNTLTPALHYWRGRCLEEIGAHEDAVRVYAQAIRSAGNHPVSRDANRRLYALGALFPGLSFARDVALSIHEILPDSVFEEMRTLQFTVIPAITREAETDADSAELWMRELVLALSALRPDRAIQPPGKSVQSGLIEVAGMKGHVVQMQSIPAKVRLMTRDGRLYFGILLTSPRAPIVKIQTLLGVVGVAREEIERIE